MGLWSTHEGLWGHGCHNEKKGEDMNEVPTLAVPFDSGSEYLYVPGERISRVELSSVEEEKRDNG